MPTAGTNIVRGNGLERRSIAFRFFPQGASVTPYTVANGQLVDSDGWIALCQRTAAGRYQVTLSTPVARLLSGQVTAQNISASDTFGKLAQIINEGTTSALDLRVEHIGAGAGADMAADANNSMHVTLEVEFDQALGALMKGPDALALLIGTKPGGAKPPGKGATEAPSMSGGAGARAGKRLASALQGGEGNAIYEAFRALHEMCAEGGEPDEGPAEDTAEGEPKGL